MPSGHVFINRNLQATKSIVNVKRLIIQKHTVSDTVLVTADKKVKQMLLAQKLYLLLMSHYLPTYKNEYRYVFLISVLVHPL